MLAKLNAIILKDRFAVNSGSGLKLTRNVQLDKDFVKF